MFCSMHISLYRLDAYIDIQYLETRTRVHLLSAAVPLRGASATACLLVLLYSSLASDMRTHVVYRLSTLSCPPLFNLCCFPCSQRGVARVYGCYGSFGYLMSKCSELQHMSILTLTVLQFGLADWVSTPAPRQLTPNTQLTTTFVSDLNR